ncbi:NRDE family protein [Roseococcus sp. DSY-14]|uniref:NRDE family protein n=1 Tax=Roseococcus sp. DSY-14 TaxID=3369650 RepID=UPI00387B7057
MCTVILWRGEGRCALAANRDERLDRAWDPPGRFWPGITGGRDRAAGGTWMAMNAAGVVAAVLNRPGTLGPAAGKRSRGELPLVALGGADAAAAADRIAALPAGEWRPFHLVVADAGRAFFLKGLGEGRPAAQELGEGVSMVTAHPPNDPASPRTARHLPRFRAAAPPRPGDWGAWPALLADGGGRTEEALNVPPLGGFGTVCASLVMLAPGGAEWLFAPGPPDRTAFAPVPLG